MDRQAILQAHGNICGECGRMITDDAFDVDHIVPRARGGTDELANLRPTHRVCNRSKSVNETASWRISRPPKEHRPVGEVYDRLIGIPNYVTVQSVSEAAIRSPRLA